MRLTPPPSFSRYGLSNFVLEKAEMNIVAISEGLDSEGEIWRPEGPKDENFIHLIPSWEWRDGGNQESSRVHPPTEEPDKSYLVSGGPIS